MQSNIWGGRGARRHRDLGVYYCTVILQSNVTTVTMYLLVQHKGMTLKSPSSSCDQTLCIAGYGLLQSSNIPWVL